MMLQPLLYISIISFGSWFLFLYKTRGIQFMSPTRKGWWADNEIMVYAARHANTWRWPSDMHKMNLRYTHMKDMTILTIALFQRIMRDKYGPHPLIAAFSFPIPVSTIIIYILSATFWSNPIGIFVSLLYLSCIWPWQIGLFGGHINIATMFMMFGFLALVCGYYFFTPWLHFWLIAAGICFGCMTFSSSSWYRFIPMTMASLFYAQHPSPDIYTLNKFATIIYSNYFPPVHLWGVLVLALGLTLLWIATPRVISNAYLYKWFFISAKARERYTVTEYIQRTRDRVKTLSRWTLAIYALFMISIFVIGVSIGKFVFLGYGIVLFVLMFPNFISNILHYMEYVYGAFVVMDTGFSMRKKLGDPIYQNIPKRGVGFKWLIKIYVRMTPIHGALTLGLTIASAIFIALNIYQISWLAFALIVITGLSPILWAELSQAVQIGRPYSTGFTGFLILIGFGSYVISPHLNYPIIWGAIIWLVALLYNLWLFIYDVLPARMETAYLIKTLERLNIKEFSTYDTYYNYSHLQVIDPNILKKYKINYIKTMDESPTKWLVVPPTSCKSASTSAPIELEHVDFTGDPVLNKLFDGHEIEKIATAKFISRGTSRFWTHEGEIGSFRDFFVHDMNYSDKLRTCSWLLNIEDVPKDLRLQNK